MNDQLQRTRDALLIIQYQAGDDGALEQLISHHAGAVRAFVISRLGGDIAVVDDLVQDVWLQVIRGIRTLKEPLAWQAWLNRLASIQVALFLRRKRRPAVPLDLVPEPIVTEEMQRLDAEAIQQAVLSLEAIHQSVVRLRFWESKSYQEIAHCLDLPVGTVRSRLHSARNQLVSVLAERKASPNVTD